MHFGARYALQDMSRSKLGSKSRRQFSGNPQGEVNYGDIA